MGEPVVFGTSFTALFVLGLARPLGPAAQEQLRASGLDLGKPLQPAYPLATWVKALAVAARELHPNAASAQAYEQLGRATIVGLQQVPTGRAAHEKNLALGVRRALERMTRSFRISNNYLEVELAPDGHALELRVVPEFLPQVERDGLPPPAFYAGVFAETLTGWGARDVRVELASEDRVRRAYRFTLAYAEPASAG